MINLQLMNKAVFDTELTDKEFRTLYLICNYAALNNTNTIQLHNGWLMDKLNLCERQVRNITNGLDAKGYIKKEVTGTKKNKNANTYTIIEEINDEIIEEMNEEKKLEINCEINDEIKLEKNCPLKKNIKEIKKEYNNNIYNINNITLDTSDDDRTFEDYLFNDDEQGSNNVAESEQENEMITSTSGYDINNTKDITSTEELVNDDATTCDDVEFDNLFVSSKSLNDDCSIFNEDCPKTLSNPNPFPSLNDEKWKPVVWDENAIFGSGERQNVSVDNLSTQGKKSRQEAQECPQNETEVFQRIYKILEEALGITDVEPFKAKLQEALDLLRQIRPNANRNAFTRCCDDTIYWYTQNNWDDWDMFSVASDFKRDIERMKRA